MKVNAFFHAQSARSCVERGWFRLAADRVLEIAADADTHEAQESLLLCAEEISTWEIPPLHWNLGEYDPLRIINRKIYTILEEEVGAPRHDATSFEDGFIDCLEWRFYGDLGFGGKVRPRTDGEGWVVTCYPEDETLHRQEAMTKANRRLKELTVV